MINLDEIRETCRNLADKYKRVIDANRLDKVYRKLDDGIRVIDRLSELANNLSGEIETGDRVLHGAMAVARRATGQYQQDDQKSIEVLRKMYDGERGLIKRTLSKITGRDLALRDALGVVENIAEKIPSYVTNLSDEVSNRRVEFTNFRAGLRQDIENLIKSESSIETGISVLEEPLKKLQEEYGSLENERKTNAEKNELTSPEKIERLRVLDLVIGEVKETAQELQIKKDTLRKDIELMNNQVGKIGQYLDLLDESQRTITLGKKFVDLQIPYVIRELRAQNTQVQALTGVNKVVTFLENQSEFSAALNSQIKSAAGYLEQRVQEVRESITNEGSIYLPLRTTQNVEFEILGSAPFKVKEKKRIEQRVISTPKTERGGDTANSLEA